MDVSFTEWHNIRTVCPGCNRSLLADVLRQGWFLSLKTLLRVVQGGLVHAGPPCSSWVWINRGTSGRSSWRPEGDRSQMSVVEANESPGHQTQHSLMVRRTLCLQSLFET